jgi:hypothetical protein
MLNQNTISEATRLTQAGQLVEATALLQRMLRGERALDATSLTPGSISLPGREPPTIDGKANDVEKSDSAHLTRAPSAATRRPQPLFDRAKDGSWLGMRGVKRTPPSTPEIVPEGAKFIEGAYSNPAGSRTYKLFVPSGYQGQPLPLVVMLHGCTQSPDDFAAGTRMNFIAEEKSVLRGLSCTAQRRQPVEMLELVSHSRPAARRRGALHYRGHHPPGHARLFG